MPGQWIGGFPVHVCQDIPDQIVSRLDAWPLGRMLWQLFWR